MYPNDLWISDPNSGQLFKVESDLISLNVKAPTGATAIHVAQDMLHVYIASSYLEEVSTVTSTTQSPGTLVSQSATTDPNSGLVGTSVTTTTKTLERHRVSKYRNGVRVQDIDVGRQPCAFCEDGHGNIWVACYADNTVQKITNGKVVATITVHSGPRDIIADSRNKIFVACYNANCVDVITNDVLVDSIDVSTGPRAITCDYVDNIWVCCYTANVLTKIKNSRKVLDLDLKDLSRSPSDVVVNSKGVIYVSNYFGNTVIAIKTQEDAAGTTATVQSIISVHNGPTALGVTRDDEIYVLSEIDGVVDKIADSTRVHYFNICTNPVGFGDFTGCETYNIYHYDGTNSDKMPIGGWTRTYLSSDIQQLLGQIESGEIETDASMVTYHSDKYTTVEEALDKLFAVDPVLLNFKIQKDLFEYGETITTLTLEWALNVPVAKIEVKNGAQLILDFDDINWTGFDDQTDDTIPLSGAYPFPVSIMNPTSAEVMGIQVWITPDGVDATPKLVTNANLYFGNKIRYGHISVDTSVIGQNEIAALEKSSLYVSSSVADLTDRPFNKYFLIQCPEPVTTDNVTEIPVIAVPSDWGVDTKQITLTNGYLNNWYKTTVTFQNDFGAVRQYDVFTHRTPLAGDFIGTIIELA